MAAAGGSKRGSIALARRHAGDDWSALSLASANVPIAGIAVGAAVALAPSLLKAYRAWRKTRVAALVISTAEAKALRWPQGDPTKYELYIGSPADPRTYYPAASFHEDVLFERYGELRELLTRLGARRIEARVTRGRKFDGSVSAGVPLPNGAGTLKGEVNRQQSETSSREDLREMEPSEPNLADRTGVDDLSSLVTMLIQTDKFGTSIAQSLRVYSDTLRTKRRQRAEEAAAKTGVKMVFPLVFCIFPAVWVVTIGPAVIKIVRVLFPLVESQK